MADVALALANHDRLKRSTDLPLFYGRKDKDIITAHQLINRFDRAAVIADWDEPRQCSEFNLILRDKALLWWDALPNISEHANVQTNIVNLKAAFLDYYAPKYTAKATCNLFVEMQQKSGESVTDYYLRVDDALKRLVEAKPAAMNDAVVAALPAGVNLAQALVFKREGIKQDEQFFLQQLFTAGLREDIRTKVMEANMPSIREALKVARDTEVVYNDRKSKGATINSVQSENSADEEEEGEGEIDAIRGKDGKFKSSKKSQGKKETGKTKFDGNCRYCNKYGHSQKYCFSRKQNNAPMVDAKGVPFKSGGPPNGTNNGSKVHNVQEGTNNVDLIAQFNSLNW